jgi:DNA-binding SARP family transcriptional activator
MGYLFFTLLGPFQVWSGEERLEGFRTTKERALLAYLVAEAGRPQRRAALAELLWPDRPEGSARNSLRQALYGVRRVLKLEENGDGLLLVTPDEVNFHMLERVWLDAAAFQVHLQAAKMHAANHREPCLECLQHLKEAVEIYHGDFLADIHLDDSIEFEAWRESRRQQLLQAQSQADRCA